MTIRIEEVERDGLHVIRPQGEVDLYSSPELRSAILKAVSGEDRKVEVDLSEVPYMDSSGVATLVEGLQAVGGREGAFALVSPSPAVLKVLQLSRLDSVFEIREAP